jgi:hypothetical protein
MGSLAVRAACRIVNLLLGAPGATFSAVQEAELTLARGRDPYFHAFRTRCMQWVYGHDPRRALEAERGPS